VRNNPLQDDKAAEAGLQPVRSPVTTTRPTFSASWWGRPGWPT